MAGGFGRKKAGAPRLAAQAVILGLAIGMAGVLAIQSSPDVRKSFDGPRAGVEGATAKLTSGPARQISGIPWWGADKRAQARIAELEAQVRALSYYREAARAMSERMTQYEQLLDLVGESPEEGVTARVVAEADGPFAATRIANAGALHGVREGFAAVNEYGLVGRVIRVGEQTSRILLVTDFSSRIPVMGTVSQDRALLVGERDRGASLRHAETPDRVVEGEIWVTSGDDGLLPRGLEVGRAVRDETVADGGWRLDLAMARGGVDFVRLAPPPQFVSPEADPALERGPAPNTEDALQSVAAASISAVEQ